MYDDNPDVKHRRFSLKYGPLSLFLQGFPMLQEPVIFQEQSQDSASYIC